MTPPTVLLPRATRDTSGESALATNQAPVALGAGLFYVDVFAVSGDAPALTVTIEGRKSPHKDAFVPLLTSAVLTMPGRTVLSIAPDLRIFAEPSDVRVQGNLPRDYRVQYSIEGGALEFAVSARIV